ncbi:hypothetical protein B0T26DRAFT_629172, partial [Lasiosphaeria miniovina]
MAKNTDYEGAKFNKPSDWDEWRQAYEKKAENAGILNYVHPNPKLRKPWPTEPAVPQYDDYQKKQLRQAVRSSNNNNDNDDENVNRSAARTRAATAARSARSRTTRRSYIEVSDHNPDDENDDTPQASDSEEEEEPEPDAPKITKLSDLTAIGQTDWKSDFEMYKEKKSTYNAKTTHRSKLYDWILKSIGPNYCHITKGKDIPDIYQALKEHQIKTFERKLGEWTTRWQNLVSEGIEQKVPQIATPSSWYDDLTVALKQIRDGKTWALGELATLEENIL